MTKIEETADKKLIGKVFASLLEAGKTLDLMFDGEDFTEKDTERLNIIVKELLLRLVVSDVVDNPIEDMTADAYVEKVKDTRNYLIKLLTIMRAVCDAVEDKDTIKNMEKKIWGKISE